jgi:hypothetical protein
MGRIIRSDMDVDEPRLPILEEDESLLEAHASSANGLDFAAL